MKTLLLTGASGAIGKSIAKVFLDNGYFVVGQYNLGETSVKELKKEFPEKFFPFKADLKYAEETNKLLEYFYENFSHANVFIHCAGKDVYRLSQETSEEEWDDLFNINVKSAFILNKRVIPDMVNRKSGKIIFITSVWGKFGASMESAYSASKAALSVYAKSLAKELGPSSVTVNCVCPGVINSPMNARFNKEEVEELILRTPLGRIGTPKEVANLCRFIAEDGADFITGQEIVIDGGFTL